MSRRLEVLLQDRLVGHLSEETDGGVEFRFLDSYRDLVPRPVLGQKFEDDLERVHRNRKGKRLPDFFANLVPEGRLRKVIEKSAELESGDDLALLTFVGRDLPGAVVLRPREDDGPRAVAKESTGAPPAEDDSATSSEGLRFSLAGVQMKFSMLLREDKLTLPARNETGDWIVKFDSPAYQHVPENEYSMLSWARAAGFDVPECRLSGLENVVGRARRYAPDGSRLLAIRRYDRKDEGGRVHQEDFAQAVGLPPEKRYDQITYEVMARLVRRFIGEEAVGELVRRLTFVVASGNADAHLKNWSLVYPDTIQAQWAPLYDQVATIAWPGLDRLLALKLAGVKDFGQIDRAAFERFAEKAEIDRRQALEVVDETLTRLLEVWSEIAADLPLPSAHMQALREHWRKVPLLRAAGTFDVVR